MERNGTQSKVDCLVSYLVVHQSFSAELSALRGFYPDFCTIPVLSPTIWVVLLFDLIWFPDFSISMMMMTTVVITMMTINMNLNDVA